MTQIDRWYQILNQLQMTPEKAKKELQTELGISRQTLDTSIEQLNDLLKGVAKVDEQESRLRLIVSDYEHFEDVLLGSLKKESDFNAPSKRISYILKRLIDADESLLIDDLADEMMVSRGTINKDLKVAKEIANRYDIAIIGRPNKGLRAEGSEFNKRLLYINQVYDYFEVDNVSETLVAVVTSLSKLYHLPRHTQILLLKTLSTMIGRLSAKQFLDQINLPLAIVGQANPLLEDILYCLESDLEMTLSQAERDFLSLSLNLQYHQGLQGEGLSEERLQTIYQKIMSQIHQEVIVTFNEEELFKELEEHLKFMINRLIFRNQISDIFQGELRDKYPFAYRLSEISAKVLEAQLGVKVDETEISYLALYFEMFLKGAEVEEAIKPKIAVVCNTGRGTANMIQQQLRKVLGDHVEIDQYAEETFNLQTVKDYFAVFTTFPLRFQQEEVPVIHLTHLFNENWLMEEWQKVQRHHQKQMDKTKALLMHLGPQDSYEAYLQQIIDSLENLQFVDVDFRHRIFEREARQTSLFGQNIAFPHTINKGSPDIILGLGLLEEPLWIEGESLEFIFLLAIPEVLGDGMEEDLLDVYDLIFKFSNDTQMKDTLRNIPDQDRLIEWLKEGKVLQ